MKGDRAAASPSALALKCVLRLWAVEYSARQQAFHVQRVESMLEQNAANILSDGGWAPDYVPVSFALSHEEATALREKLQALQECWNSTTSGRSGPDEATAS